MESTTTMCTMLWCFLSAHHIFHILHVYASVVYPLTSAVCCCLTFECTISTAMHSVHCLAFSYCTDGRGSCASLQSVSTNVKHDSPLFVYFAQIMPKKKSKIEMLVRRRFVYRSLCIAHNVQQARHADGSTAFHVELNRVDALHIFVYWMRCVVCSRDLHTHTALIHKRYTIENIYL